MPVTVQKSLLAPAAIPNTGTQDIGSIASKGDDNDGGSSGPKPFQGFSFFLQHSIGF
jgi:hypothetical protein